MQCDEVRAGVPRYVSGDLSHTEVEEMDRHLDRCAACTALVDEHVAALGMAAPTAQDQELLRLMRVPVPSPEETHSGMQAVLQELQRRRVVAPQSAIPNPQSPIPGSWLERLRGDRWPRHALGYAAAAAAVVALGLFAWNQQARSRTLERQLAGLKRQNEVLHGENAALRREMARITSPPTPAPPQPELQQQVASLQAENDRLKRQLARATAPPGALAALRDGVRTVTVARDGAVLLVTEAPLPASLAPAVRELVLKGSAPPAKPVAMAMATLRADATRGALRGAREAEKLVPLPLAPVLTAVRSPQVTLRWRAVLGAQEFRVRVAYPEEKESGKVIWEGSAGTEAELALPAGTFQRGQPYFWQVEARVGEEARLSPAVGFWVLDEKTLREVEAVERQYPDSALTLAALYETHGLYNEARAQLDRVATANPNSPFVTSMIEHLNRQVGDTRDRAP